MKVHKTAAGILQANCYICWCEATNQAVIIDPGGDAQRLSGWLKMNQLELVHIILTHFHFDHTQGALDLRAQTGALIALHRDDAPLLEEQPALFRGFAGNALPSIEADVLLDDDNYIAFGQETLQVIATPGHSPGSICLYHRELGVVFSGDTLFRDGVGRTDFPGGDSTILFNSIRSKLFCLPDETVVYPGHGPKTTIGHEKQSNPFI